jgi:hypothetical protein
MFVPMSYFEADAEWARLKARRDRILDSDDHTGFCAAQNALSLRSEALSARYRDEVARGFGVRLGFAERSPDVNRRRPSAGKPGPGRTKAS